MTEATNSKLLHEKPDLSKMQLQEKCGASWQVITNRAMTKLQCRHCGVVVVNGGTPKCLKTK